LASAGIFDFVITPAVVSGVIIFLFSQRGEGKKARRDYDTKIFDAAREDVKKAMEAGVDYFATPFKNRDALLEAKVIVLEIDVRRSIARIVRHSQQKHKTLTNDVSLRLIGFLSILTGGSFQQKNSRMVSAEEDASNMRKLAAEGAHLRVALADLRDEQLEQAIIGWKLRVKTQRFFRYLKEQKGYYQADD
jgi:hypothetical protein